jgi:DNA-binding PadR family transcriptional regulator
MAGEWPANLNWRLMSGKGRGRRPDPEELERLIALRHLRGGGPGFDGPRGRGRGRGRGRRRRGDVRAALLLLLTEGPLNGYQLMQTIEERSGGVWRPSPGSVYPSLSQLEDEGFVRAVEHDGTRLFEITDAGRAHIAERNEEKAPWDLSEDGDDAPTRHLRPMVRQIATAIMQVDHAGDERQIEKAAELLNETRRGLYRILAEDQLDEDATDEGDEPATA